MRIHAIQTGTVAVKTRQRDGATGSGPVRLANTLRDPQWTEPLPIFAWVVEHPEGLIVIDTGETARTAEPGYFPWWHPYYRFGVKEWVRPEDEIGPQMRALGLSPDDVRWVIMTHFHTDHAGGLYHFPKAEFIASRRDYQQASGLTGRLQGFLPQHWPAWFSPRLVDFHSAPLGPFPASAPVTDAGDVQLVPTEGHTAGQQAVIVHDGELALFFAGDTSYTEEHLINQVVDGVTQDVATAQRSLARTLRYVQQQPTVYLPSHDPCSAERLANRQVTTPSSLEAVM